MIQEGNIGIYKITSPSGRVYIGQSVDLKSREKHYMHHRCKGQRKLYSSLEKYGFNNHEFEIIQYCNENELNLFERRWQEHYNVIEYGLNLKLTKTDNKSGKLSEETKAVLSESHKGVLLSEEHKRNIGISGKGRTVSKETRGKISIGNKGKLKSELAKSNMSKGRTGMKLSSEHKENIGKSGKGLKKPRSKEALLSIKEKTGKKIIDNNTGIIYDSVSDYAKSFKINRSSVYDRLRSKNFNIKYYKENDTGSCA